MRTLIMYLAPLLVGGLCACGAGASGSPDALTDDAAPDDAAPDDAATDDGGPPSPLDAPGAPDADPAICHGAACPGGASITVASRAFNLCLRADPAGPGGARCAGDDASIRWRLIDTGQPGRHALQHEDADACLVAIGASLTMAPCNPASAAAWWTVTPVPGDNGNHVYLRSAGGLCLTNGSLAGEGGAVTLSACDAGYWTQQWKPLGAQTDVSGAPDAPWLGHTRSCDDAGVVNGTCDANGRWWLATACESPTFVPVRGLTPNTGFGCVRPGEFCELGTSCLLQRGFTPIAGTTRHVFTMALDKINQPVAAIDDTYTDAFLTDLLGPAGGQPVKPRLSEDYVLEARLRLHAAELQPAPPYPGHARVLLGVAAVDVVTGRSLFVEVVVYRDGWYDLCTPTENRGGAGVSIPCDPTNLYDRRSAWATGEQVWFTSSTLNDVPGALASAQPTLAPDGEWYPFRIPVSRLFRAYGWGANVAPADWGRVQIDGIYLGLEAFGRARVWLDIDGYRLVRTANWQP